MILLLDIGNSTLHLGLAHNQRIVWNQDIPAGSTRFRPERIHHIAGDREVTGVVIGSVVPQYIPVFSDLVREKLRVEPLIVNHRVRTGLRIRYHPKSGLGADRIANATAVFHLYGRNTIVVDMGSATTLEVVTQHGEFLGGAIMPGLGMALAALRLHTALLPEVKFAQPRRLVGTSTAEAIRSGVFSSHFAGIDDLISGISAETRKCYSVVVTGGLSRRYGKHVGASRRSQSFVREIIINPLLTLQGMSILFDLNR